MTGLDGTLPRRNDDARADLAPTWTMTGLQRVQVPHGRPVEAWAGSGWALVLDGVLRLESPSGTELLWSGDAVLVDHRVAHRLVAVRDADVTTADLRAVGAGRRLPSPLVVRDFDVRHAGVVALVDRCPLRDVRRAAQFAASYSGLIGAAMTASWEEDDRPAEPLDEAVATVLDAVAARPGEPWSVDTMARLVHLSRSALGDRFRRALGRSPADVLRDVRMRQARLLLAEPGRPVEYVASRVGYGSTAAFSRAFSAHHRMSPQAWRAQAVGTRTAANTAPAAPATAAPNSRALVAP